MVLLYDVYPFSGVGTGGVGAGVGVDAWNGETHVRLEQA